MEHHLQKDIDLMQNYAQSEEGLMMIYDKVIGDKSLILLKVSVL